MAGFQSRYFNFYLPFMKLSIGIVGLPNVGKSTLFKALTQQEVNIANYPFATIDPNIGVVPVPDERLGKLAKISNSKKIIPAVVEFYDIAGLVKGANKGEGLGNQFLSHIREVNAIVNLVRCFRNEEIIHVENKINPSDDIDVVNTELVLKDLETVKKRIGKVENEILKKAETLLGANKPVSDLSSEILSEPVLRDLCLLTAKPQIYFLNGKESDVSGDLKKKISDSGSEYIVADLSETTDLSPLIKKTYKILGLISFLTTGEDETRAWTIKKGTKAPEAAGVIHTDFEKNFIRAETINWEKLLEAGSWVQAKQKGWIRIEGKDYEVQDGDVMVIRHS